MNANRFLARAMQVVRARRFKRFEQMCQDPRRTQEAFLRDLVESHGKTAHARRLGVPTSPAVDVAAFRAAVPLTSYEDIVPEVDAALGGAPDQLAPGHPVFFAMTSGTSK